MRKQKIHNWLNYLIAGVWITNGLFCKVLGLVPRHQEIVANILSINDARPVTLLIGLAETVMAVWIVIGGWPRLNAVIQIIVIATMNILEFILTPEALLWGKGNVVFAFLFIILIYLNTFYIADKNTSKEACYHS